MGKKSFFYKDPRIFKLGLLLIHGSNLKERYKYISQQIGEKKKVLEPACGPALLSDFLDESNNYEGFDLNERFIDYAKKKGLNVELGDATDPESYSEADVVVLCDAIHHFGLKDEKKALKYSLNSAKEKLIVCDPFKDDYLKMIPKWFPKAENILEKWYNYIERDGNNQVKFKNIRTKKELKEVMMEGFDIVPKGVERELKNIGEDWIVTYYL